MLNPKLTERKEQADQAWAHWNSTRETCRKCYLAASAKTHFSKDSELWAKYDKAVKVNHDAFRSAHEADEYYWYQESRNIEQTVI